MIETLFFISDAALLAMGAYVIYWQSKIDMRGGYSMFQVFFAALLGSVFVSSGSNHILYIVFAAATLTLVLMAGNSGITPTRVIATGVFSRVIPYAKLSGITLTPLDFPNGRQMVLAIFSLTPRRFVRLTFRTDLETMVNTLRPRVPDNIEIAIQHVQ